MTDTILRTALALAFYASTPSWAATVDVSITGSDGHPAAFAVAELFPQAGSATSMPPSRLPAEAVIDQRNETFIPLVTVIRRGGHVVFNNSDRTMHQVYSFSTIKQFAFEIDQGQKSAPMTFDQSGVAAIGCNIHDQMVTFVYIADTPWAVRMDVEGHAEIDQVPPGDYRVSVWDPQLMPGYHPEAAALKVTDNGAKLSLSIPLLAGDMPGMKHAHTQSY
jgi:plastocyanin